MGSGMKAEAVAEVLLGLGEDELAAAARATLGHWKPVAAGGGGIVAAAKTVKCFWTVLMQRMPRLQRSFQRAAQLVGGGAVRRRVASGGGGIGQARRAARAGPPPQARATAAALLRDPHGCGNGGGNGGDDRDGRRWQRRGSGGGGGSAGGAGQLDSRNIAFAREDTARRARRRLAQLRREGLLRPLRLHERTGRGGREQAEAIGNRADSRRPVGHTPTGMAAP